MLSKFKNYIVSTFVYAGITPEEYDSIRPAREEKNKGILFVTSGLGTLVFFVLFMLSLFEDSYSHNTILYSSLFFCELLVLIFAWFFLKKKPDLITPITYLSIFAIFGYAIILGTFNSPTITSTTFCVFLIAIPMIIMDRPWRLITFNAIQVVIFCLCSNYVKEWEIASVDILNAASFYFLGAVLNTYMIKTKAKELTLRRYIEHDRDTDPLTLLYTKAAVGREISKHINNGGTGVFMFVDLDNFKKVNDTYGHAFGDDVLHEFGDCIRRIFRHTDILGRFGGDEFIIFLPHPIDDEIISTRAQDLLDLMQENIKIEDESIDFHASIGIAKCPENGATYEDVMAKADQALYYSKRNGKNMYKYYDDLPEDYLKSLEEQTQN
ncbi:MAG: diguanylate cyclase [Clostridia bacterium]|nr:diguanylate cyclase [Clostridia bacterium]